MIRVLEPYRGRVILTNIETSFRRERFVSACVFLDQDTIFCPRKIYHLNTRLLNHVLSGLLGDHDSMLLMRFVVNHYTSKVLFWAYVVEHSLELG
jgi:hypothetical protein